ncbi:hypothetical protein EWI07_11935 [Sporolactobacillus sp. THM7-4]|nr:hypothetical protein EWI07_11935 [Sporolactobacillus sp. THM7-4]
MNADEMCQHPLNRLRLDHPEQLLPEWLQLFEKDRELATRLINDPQLEFPVLFSLKDDIEVRGIELNPRMQIALAHTRNVLKGAEDGFQSDSSFADQHDLVVDSLLWILRTGWNTILSTDYVQVIDQTAIQVLLTYNQDWVREMVDLIVYRYKNRSQRHYLISALLETSKPVYLIYLANYLLSDQTVESGYAHRLLAFIPEVRHSTSNKSAFLAFENWYEENEHYLVYTGVTNDAFPGGVPYRIHFGAKYLGKAVDPGTGEPRQILLPEERDHYLAFLKLPRKIQVALSSYSVHLRKQQPNDWQSWIERPLSEQAAPFRSLLHRGEMNTYDYR